MEKVLFVKANNRPSSQSITVQLYDAFWQSYRETHPEDTMMELDLYQTLLPYLGNTLIQGLGKEARGERLTEIEKDEVDAANRYLQQFIRADKIVIAFPLWNLTVPAVLHTYLDYMHRPRKTFRYTEDGAVGLLTDKKVALLHASGGELTEEDHGGLGIQFVQKHLQFFGISQLTQVVIHGHHQYPDRSQQKIDQGIKEARDKARQF